ncbi:unnamed protein product [Bathycoccus prasinos]
MRQQRRQITRSLLQKRAEHNDGIVRTLKEVSLHQEKLERIGESLQRDCRELRILLLHENQIGKLENLNRLKYLRYLNVSLNNITRIENLDGCESLEKLDLTGNFLDVTSIEPSMENLSKCEGLRSLFLIGNPCLEEFERLREYVIGCLPGLAVLDGKEITEEERRECAREKGEIVKALKAKIEEKKKEEEKKASGSTGCAWNAKTRYESFLEEERTKNNREEEKETSSRKIQSKRTFERPKKPPREGFDELPENTDAILQVNEGKYEFKLGSEGEDIDADANTIILRVQIPKHFDTSLVDVDCHSEIVRVLIKGELLLLRFPEKVREETCKASRSQTTGELKVCVEKMKKKMMAKDFVIAEAALGCMKINDQATSIEDSSNDEGEDLDETFIPPITA